MEMIYRGYPYVIKESQKNPVSEAASPEPQYSRQNAVLNRRNIRRENEYLKELYPASVRRSQVLVDEWFDRYEYPGSPVYDEYPDREWLLRLRDRIWGQAKAQGADPAPDMLYILLISEIGRRRMAGLQ